MPGAGVDLDVMRDVVPVELFIERASCVGGAILPRVEADHGPTSLGHLQRARVGAVEGRDGLETRVGAGPGNGEPTTHAEADGAQALSVNAAILREVGERGLEVVDSVTID